MHIPIGILIFLIILSIVISIHELGHYLAARKAGIFVEEFALGMGPILLSYRGKKVFGHDEDAETSEKIPLQTLFSLRAFPIGGFCRMRGQDEAVPDDPLALNNKTIPQRALVMAGGSMMNFALAFLLFFIFIMFRGTPAPEIFVAGVTEGMPAHEAGLLAGDRITHINGEQVDLNVSFVSIINESGGRPLDIQVLRDEARYDLSITPVWQEYPTPAYFIGLNFATGINFQRANIFQGITGSAEMIYAQVVGPFHLLSRLLQGEQLAEGEGVMGPIGMGGAIVEVYQATIQHSFFDMFMTMLLFTAAINAALGIMNLLPIPALDGARLVFLFIEAVRRKPVPPEKEAIVHLVGIVSLLLLAVFIAYRDVINLIGTNGYPG